MVFQFFYKVWVNDRPPHCLHADSPNQAIAYLVADGVETGAIARIEVTESGKASWKQIYPGTAA